MRYSKKSPEGFSKRIETLKNFCLHANKIVDSALSKYRRKEVSKDDVLDALSAAVTAELARGTGFEYMPCEPEKDSEGLSIQMVYCIPESNARVRLEKE